MTGSTKIYSGRVEYRAVQEEVERKLAAGHRVRPVYEELARAGRLTISYSTFCAYVRGQGNRKSGRKKPSPVLRPDPRSALRPGSEPGQPHGFSHERMADLEELGPPAKAR